MTIEQTGEKLPLAVKFGDRTAGPENDSRDPKQNTVQTSRTQETK